MKFAANCLIAFCAIANICTVDSASVAVNSNGEIDASQVGDKLNLANICKVKMWKEDYHDCSMTKI